MLVLNSMESKKVRQQYIQSFVDTESNYYIDRIKKVTEFSDGFCYVGYLWDCFKNPQVISESQIKQMLKGIKDFYIMWDIHSCERILIPNYWRYPKTSVLFVDAWSDEIIKELPEDIYLFDDSFDWSIVYTHETDENGNRYCIYLSEK